MPYWPAPEEIVIKFNFFQPDRFLAEKGDGLGPHVGGTEVNQHVDELTIEGIGLGRVKGADGCDDLFGGGLIRLAHADETEGKDAQGFKLLGFAHVGRGVLAESIKEGGLVTGITLPCQGEQSGEGGLEVAFLEGPRGPVADRLVLEGNPRSVAEEAVLVPEAAPDLVDGTGDGFAMVLLQLTAFHAEGAIDFLILKAAFLGGFSGVGHPVEGGLSSAAADCKVHVAILADHSVGHVQWYAGDEFLLHAPVA